MIGRHERKPAFGQHHPHQLQATGNKHHFHVDSTPGLHLDGEQPVINA
jgi:hypothetical protein